MIRIIAAFIAWISVSAVVAQTLTPTGGGGGATLGANTFTGAQTFPQGTSSAPSLKFGTDTNTGWYQNAINQWTFVNGGANQASFFNHNIRLDSGEIICWSNADSTNGCDTGMSRHATGGVIDFGSGSAQSTAGGIQTGNATLLSLTTGTNADFLCLNAGGGILIQNTACTISSLRFKPDWKPYKDDATAKIAKMDVGTFHLETGPNADPNARSLQAGLSAESVAAIAPECAIYENDMKTPKSYRQECVIALLVKAVQQLNKK